MLFKGMKGWGGEEGALACMGERTSVAEMPTSAQATEARWSEHTPSLCNILNSPLFFRIIRATSTLVGVFAHLKF